MAARGFTAPYASFPSGATLAQALRPFPQFGRISDQYERDGNTWYDALQVKVTKRLGNGLSGGLGYSWSKDLGTVSSTGTYTTAIPIQDPTLPPKSQKSYVAIDQPQMLNFYFNYEVPRFGFSQSGWKRAVLCGLDNRRHLPLPERFSDPDTEFDQHSDSVTFGRMGTVWANRVPGQPLFLHSLNSHNVNPRHHVLSQPRCVVKPRARDLLQHPSRTTAIIRGPRYPSEQLGFGKVIPIKEGMKFSLRADFFNVFNRWAYPGLNNTGNPFQAPQYNGDGSIANGFGFFGNSISGAGGNFAPRSGEFVARIQF